VIGGVIQMHETIMRGPVSMVRTFGALAALVVSDASADATPQPPVAAVPFSAAATLTDLVQNGTVAPNWIGGSDEFWYERDTRTGHDFRIVAAPTGRARDAFDHAALSAALVALGEQAPAAALPLSELELDDGVRRARVPSPATDVSVSPDGRMAAFVRDVKLWVRDVAAGT
jgi:hypothetical protein